MPNVGRARVGQRQRTQAACCEQPADADAVVNTGDINAVPLGALPKLSAVERRQLFARLLWLDDYKPILEAERAAQQPLLATLTREYTSAHTRRLMAGGSSNGLRAIQQVESRLRDCIGFLDRSRNRNAGQG